MKFFCLIFFYSFSCHYFVNCCAGCYSLQKHWIFSMNIEIILCLTFTSDENNFIANQMLRIPLNDPILDFMRVLMQIRIGPEFSESYIRPLCLFEKNILRWEQRKKKMIETTWYTKSKFAGIFLCIHWNRLRLTFKRKFWLNSKWLVCLSTFLSTTKHSIACNCTVRIYPFAHNHLCDVKTLSFQFQSACINAGA